MQFKPKSLRMARRICLSALLTIALAHTAHAAESISLEGTWACKLDPQKLGVAQKWFTTEIGGSIHLPGSTDQARLGPGNPKPADLSGLYRPWPYVGPAWYQRDIDIPEKWRGSHITLLLERCHWQGQAWIDGKPIGARDSLITPQVYELGAQVSPGKHRLTICMDNTSKFNLGEFVSILYEGTQTNWNGIVGRIELRATPAISIADVQIYPDVQKKLATVRVKLANGAGSPAKGSLVLNLCEHESERALDGKSTAYEIAGAEGIIELQLRLPRDVKLWDEFSPALYDVHASLVNPMADSAADDQKTTTFGVRQIGIEKTQFTMNGRTIFIRGTLECGIFPLTGFPPTDVPNWQRIYRIIKSHGLNSMRFHSWCPPEAAFAAADLGGIYLQVEAPQANVRIGSEPKRDQFIENEVRRLLETYGNHPSFCLLSMGNEMSGDSDVAKRLVDIGMKEDPRHLYTSSSNGVLSDNRQFTVGVQGRGVRGEATEADLSSVINKLDRPLISHEIGQWTVYPNLDEIAKYTGVLQARNFDIVRDDLNAKHMLDLAPAFFHATGKLAALLYKEEVEVMRRTQGHAGFQLLDLHDYPGQGTALVGVLDPFWDSKNLIDPKSWSRFCGPTTPLLRFPKRTYTIDEPFAAAVELSHFGPADMTNVTPTWTIKDAGGVEIASGALSATAFVPTGKLTLLGRIEASLAKASPPCKLTVSVSIQGADIANDWEIWVYPAKSDVAPPPDVVVAKKWDAAARASLEAGKKVLFLAPKGLRGSLPGSFKPVFWSPIWFHSRPGTMGILCDPAHPALAGFPTESFGNWQWFDLLQHSTTLDLTRAPAELRPIVQVIDNFSRNQKLTNLFEARASKGRLLVCSIDLWTNVDQRPAARQLLRSLYTYMSGEKFQPTQMLDVALLDKLLSGETP